MVDLSIVMLVYQRVSYITALTAGWCFATCANSPIWNDNLD